MPLQLQAIYTKPRSQALSDWGEERHALFVHVRLPRIKEDLQSRDHDLGLAEHEGRVDMSIVVEVERAVDWPRLWDLALDYGPKCVNGLKNLVRVIIQYVPLYIRLSTMGEGEYP